MSATAGSGPDPAGLLEQYGAGSAGVAELLCDRHPADRPAFRLVEPDLSVRTVSFGELREGSERVAGGLAALGVGPGDRVATLLGKSVEHLFTAVGLWRLGAVHVPLFTAFAAPAIGLRLQGSGARVVVCDFDQRRKLDELPADGRRTVVVGAPSADGDIGFAELTRSPATVAAARLGGDAPLIQLYTSGTTGAPKAVAVPTRALASFHAYLEYGLDVRADDVLWNAADPGWAYGLYYGLVGPLCLGLPGMWLRGGFSAERTWSVLAQLGVTNLAAAPTVYRQLRTAPAPAGVRLRCASSAGEPLTADVNAWAEAALGVAVRDHYGQTETGMLVNNHQHPSLRRPLREGSMGHPLPGWSVAVLAEDADEPAAPGTVGRIAVDRDNSPLCWFQGYLGDDAGTAGKLTTDGRWYLTGDTGRADADGYLSFLSRDDDLIIMAGYRISPVDVEAALLQHPAVAEAAVVGAPDEVRGEVVVAYVVLRGDAPESPKLTAELQQLVRQRFAAHAYPRQVHYLAELPRTPSGKVQRFLLRTSRTSRTAP